MSEILKLGNDIEVAPKKAYVSLRRKKQFACLKPATKTRFELELIIKGQEPTGILEAITGAGAMCTHRIKIETENQITNDILNWIKIPMKKQTNMKALRPKLLLRIVQDAYCSLCLHTPPGILPVIRLRTPKPGKCNA